MNTDKLKSGTKLVWDAPIPYEGYNKESHPDYPGRVIIPVIVTGNLPINDRLKCHIINNSGKGTWISSEEEYLRYPTDEELNKFKWYEL